MSQIRFDVGMPRPQDEGREQQKREQMHWIDSSKACAQELEVVTLGESFKTVQIVQTQNESRQQEKQIDAHISGFIERPEHRERRKKDRDTLAEVKEHNEDSSNGAYASKSIQHFEERSPEIGEMAGKFLV
ncbi:MAG TPA: hypothetical protein VNX66_13710 [Candidatus Sulfotelmatobacter sp.]|nr:hypothetical protein [Candidatus Sulfotelmatobacter sp.]